jgi:hypothetical protein
MKPKELNALEKRYQSMSTEDLFKAATVDRKDYRQDALELIGKELAKRNLSEQQKNEVQTKVEQNHNETSETDKTLIGQEFRYTKNITSLTKILVTMLWIFLGISVLSLISDFMQLNLLGSGTFSIEQAEFNDARQRIIGILYIVAFIVVGFVFLKWIYRVNSNCHGFGAQGMKFSAGWSIGYYFIPIANWYRPYQAMKEIWKVSTNPINWENGNGSPLLGWWWTLWLISGFMGQASFRMTMRADSISSLQSSTTVSIISNFLDFPLCIVAISLVSNIFTRQENLVKSQGVIYKNVTESKKKNKDINNIAGSNVSLDKKLDNIISHLENDSK